MPINHSLASILRINELMIMLKEIYARASCMVGLPIKKAVCLISLGGLLLLVAAGSSMEPWWKGKPFSKMTPAELEAQDPIF